MNHRSQVIVIPNSSKQRCASFQWSWAVRVPLFTLKTLCFKIHCGKSATSHKASWKEEARRRRGRLWHYLSYPFPQSAMCTRTVACVWMCVYVEIRVFIGESFPYHKALGYWDLPRRWHETPRCVWYTDISSCMHIHMEVRELESLYGGVFSWQTVISELLLWVVTLWGYISDQCVGGAQGKGWIEDRGRKKEQWVIEITLLWFTM